MAFGIGEDPRRSPLAVLEGTVYPATRDQLVRIAEESEASADAINFLKCLPREDYVSEEEVLRDFGEASRRFGMSNHAPDDDGANRDRRNLGKDAVEGAPDGMTRHP